MAETRYCASCGSRLGAGARFCGSCGAAASSDSPNKIESSPVVASDVPTAPAQRRRSLAGHLMETLTSPALAVRYLLSPLLGGLTAAALAAVGCFLVVGVTYLIDRDFFLGWENGAGDVRNLVKFAGLLFYAAQRVPLEFRLSAGGSPDFSLVAQPLLVTLAIIGAYYAGGRVSARRARGSWVSMVVAGAAISVPVAIGAFLAPLVFPNPPEQPTFQVGFGSGFVSAGGSVILWTFGWSFIFGAAGGLREAFGPHWSVAIAKRVSRRIPIAEAAWRGARSGLLILFGTSLVIVAFAILELLSKNPGTRDSLFQSAGTITGSLGTTFLFLPNGLIVAGLGSLGVPVVQVAGAGGNTTQFWYGHGVPAYSLLAIAIAVSAVIRMGYVAGRASRGEPRGMVMAGLAAALPFALICWLLALVAGIRVTSNDPAVGGSIGPSGAAAFVAPVLWGVIGGWIGSLWAVGSRRNRVSKPLIPEPPSPGNPSFSG
jgi:hypothetical protein